jgi:hypothetical protein
MDLLGGKYGDGDGGAAAPSDDDEAPLVISRPVKDIAPYVNTACMTLVSDGAEQHIVNVADTQNLHGESNATTPHITRHRTSTGPDPTICAQVQNVSCQKRNARGPGPSSVACRPKGGGGGRPITASPSP